ncbi:pyridoxal-phosphate dependent enzyme [Candidatus Woesearchaeota archaeon]|nr:pyridoxal-phosphate dependent enzyme [Candidatus Woesearchaeota archaeon]
MGKNGTNNEVTLKALETIAEEIALQETKAIDYFVSAVGNGSNVLGVGRAFPKTTKVIAFETVQSAVLYDLKFPGEYEQRFGIPHGKLPRHSLPGTSYQGIDFPHIRNAASLVDDVVLLSDASLDKAYTARTGKHDTEQLPHWDKVEQFSDVGRTTHAALAVALEIAETVTQKIFLLLDMIK